MLDYSGRVAVISGSSYGMGAMYARMLAERGARVVVNGRTKSKVDDVVNDIISNGGQAVADYSDIETNAKDLIQTAIHHFGQLDILINNAAIIKVNRFGEGAADDFWKVFDVNFKGTVDLTWAAWPYLKKSDSGRIIFVSSSGIWANPGASAYGASKGAVWALGNTLAEEGKPFGIQVSTIMPTAYTPMTANAYSNPTILSTLRDHMGPEHVSAFVTYLCHQDTKVYGELYQVSGGRAGRMVMTGLPRVQAPESTPEAWAKMSEALRADSNDLVQYRNTGEQFADEMIAANPDAADAFKDINPADLEN